jgi:biopolymer transport protein ExbB/TolQ
MNALSWFASFFQGGGPFMIVILGTGLLILAISMERFWVISRASAWNAGKLSRDLTERVRRGDLRGAVDLAAKVKSPAGRVAHAVMTSGARTEQQLMSAADGEANLALAPYSRRIPHIGLLANVATLLGLLGTIFGLTTAFSAVGAADPSQRSAFLAAGISQALNTTAFGLIIAVPALMVHGFLVSRVEAIAEQVDEVCVRLVRAMVLGGSSASAPSPSGAHGPEAAAPGARPSAATRPAGAR